MLQRVLDRPGQGQELSIILHILHTRWTHTLTPTVTVTDDVAIATSNDPWGPTGTEMSEIAQITYNSYAPRHAPFGKRIRFNLFNVDPTNFTRLWTCWIND